ncbi:MAG: alanine:cation symporter family protein, partial [Chlamydiales bacterium]
MLSTIFQFLTALDGVFWGYIAFALITIFGLYLTFRSRFFQIRCLPRVFKTFFQFLRSDRGKSRGLHPLKAFLTSTGGMIGIGNVVGVVVAIQLGGPGALLWLWVAGMIGAIIKYCEIYLGLKYRVENQEGSYDGGPMYFLKKAFGSSLIPLVVASLFCVYGVDVYQFSIISQTIALNWHLNFFLVIGALLGLVLFAVMG